MILNMAKEECKIDFIARMVKLSVDEIERNIKAMQVSSHSYLSYYIFSGAEIPTKSKALAKVILVANNKPKRWFVKASFSASIIL